MISLRWACLAVCLSLTACMGGLSSSPPPQYFGLQYSPATGVCGRPSDFVVRVWDFSAATPFDRQQMIVAESGRIRFSSEYQWIGAPGAILADRVRRDLATAEVFSRVVMAADPFDATANLGGHIERFGIESEGGVSRTVLEAEVTLWRDRDGRTGSAARILFKKRYKFSGDPMKAMDAENLSREMSSLVRTFSEQLGRDLCSTD